MPRNFLKFIILGAAVSLAGCDGSESTAYPEDGRTQSNPINNTEDGTLSGRALVDGYLAEADVWLDMNQNGRWDEGEPKDESDENGHFQLDISSLEQDISVGPDLDWRDYPLMLLATVETIEELGGVPSTVDQNFLLLAPPDTTTITPFTTLIEFERRLPGFATRGGTKDQVRRATERVKRRLGPGPTGSLRIDYRQGGNAEAGAYATAIAALIAKQTNGPLAHGDPSQMLNNSSFNILAGVVLGEVGGIIEQAKAQIDASGEQPFNVAELIIEEFDLPDEDGQDPTVLYHQQLYMKADAGPSSAAKNIIGSKTEVIGSESENLSAELRYFYDEEGRLVEIEVDGWTEPDLAQLYSLVSVGGHVAQLDTQYGPGLLVRYSSKFDKDVLPKERYVFNWEPEGGKPLIEWHTNNSEIVLDAGSELNGDPEAKFSWDGQTLSLTKGSVTESLEVTYAEGDLAECHLITAKDKLPEDHPLDSEKEYKLLRDHAFAIGGQLLTRKFYEQCRAGDAEEPELSCEIGVASSSGMSPFLDTYSLPSGTVPRLLKSSTRPVSYTTTEVVQWFNTYAHPSAENTLGEDEYGLLDERVLSLPDKAPASCSLDNPGTDRVLAVTTYEYEQLSTRLAEQTRRD